MLYGNYDWRQRTTVRGSRFDVADGTLNHATLSKPNADT